MNNRQQTFVFSSTLVNLLCLLVLLSLRATPTVGQDAASAKPIEAERQTPSVTIEIVRMLLRSLESNRLQDRDAAEQQLVELGPAVLAFLPEINANTSGEMKVRLQRIRQQLQRTDTETYFKATTLSLSGKMRLSEALASIEQQTGNKIEIEREDTFDGLEIEFMEKDSSFWTVMHKIMTQAKLRVNSYTTTDGLSLAAGANEYREKSAEPFVTGPFRIEVTSVQSTLTFNSRLDGQLDLSLQVTWEPRLKPVFMQIPMSTIFATIDDDKTLASVNPQSTPEVPLNTGGASTQIDLQLARPDRSARQLSKLNGEFMIAVPSEKHKYIFKKFGNGARQSEKFGDVSVTLEGARRNGSVYEMRLLVEFGNAQGALDSFRGWILSNEAYLLDPKERRLENVGLQTYAVTPNAVGIAYLFQINGNPDDFQLIYESPALITRETVKFELKNIELP